MQVDYRPFVDRMIGRYEGPYGWTKSDPGGPTKYGITCYDLAEYRGQRMTSMTTWAPIVQAMTLAEAEAIFRTKYAAQIRFDDLPAGIDVTLMDYAVNSGVSRAILVARSLLGIQNHGADINAADIAALHRVNAKTFIDSVDAERLRFMHAIRGGTAWAEFGRGWQARVDDVRAYGEHLAAGGTPETAPPSPDLSKVNTPKAKHVPHTAGGKTAGGVVVAAGAAQAAGVPWWGVGLAAAGVIGAGIAYELWQEHKAATANAVVHA